MKYFKLSKKTTLFLFTALFLNSFFLYWILSWGKISPNTFIGKIPIGGYNINQFSNAINTLSSKVPITIILPDQKSHQTNIQNLGISFNHASLYNQLFSQSPREEFFRLLSNFFHLPSSQNISNPFNTFPESIIISPNQTSQPSEYLSFDKKTKSFYQLKYPISYQLDSLELHNLLTQSLNLKSIYLEPISTTIDHSYLSAQKLNQQLDHTLSKNLKLKIKNGTTYSNIPLDNQKISTLIDFNLHNPTPSISLDKSSTINYLLTLLTSEQQAEFQPETSYQNLISLINQRFTSSSNKTVVLGIDDGPTSDGFKDDQYLEIDISQQKMYFFQKGQLIKTTRVSTGNLYPTPTGEFHILNKNKMAFSHPFGVWMPYWMAFHYASDVGMYLGIHELAYATLPDGNPLYRLGNYIGTRGTGGCVALNHEDASKIFEISNVGMLVNIVP